ncbi:MAG: hypothetical protein IPF48_11930 [Sphingomonadales bacterium]|nr:hypothetical protein [Sphingomonadales bacterium]
MKRYAFAVPRLSAAFSGLRAVDAVLRRPIFRAATVRILAAVSDTQFIEFFGRSRFEFVFGVNCDFVRCGTANCGKL